MLPNWRRFQDIRRMLQNLPSGKPQAELYRVNFNNGKLVPEILSPFENVVRCEQPPMLFIHGAEYLNAEEVIRDLVLPFLENTGIPLAKAVEQSNIYLLYWNSSLVCPLSHQNIRQALFSFNKFLGYIALATQWKKFFHDVELRAVAAAGLIRQQLAHLLEQENPPLIVSHSFGALVWLEAIVAMEKHGILPKFLGTWLNLQPAIPEDVFASGSRYFRVREIYEQTSSQHEMWFSKRDCILAAFYRTVKKCKALGQKGSHAPSMMGLQFDLTDIVQEAHGAFSLIPGRGGFLQRAAPFSRQRVQLLLNGT